MLGLGNKPHFMERGWGLTDKETTILKNMKSLDISREEAEQLWEDDNSDYESDEMKEMGEKAKSVMRTIHGAEGDRKTFPKKNEPRERKENPTKRMIIAEILAKIETISDNCEITNAEKYISFEIGDEKYEINLIQKRKPKK